LASARIYWDIEPRSGENSDRLPLLPLCPSNTLTHESFREISYPNLNTIQKPINNRKRNPCKT
jgi:hypothetical protein